MVEGKGKTVFVSGEAGTGKTRLVKEFLNFAKHEKEFITLNGRCLSDAVIPYFPFKEAFKGYLALTAKENDSNPQPIAAVNSEEGG